jgi:hypothetical protein
MSVTPNLYEPEWDEGADAWFRRSLVPYLRKHLNLQDDPNGWCPPPCEDDPAVLEAVADALLPRRTQFVQWVDDPWYDPDVGPEGRWVIDWRALDKQKLWDLAYDCAVRVRVAREAERFPTLDDWLTALARGDVATGTGLGDELPDALREPHANHLLPGADLFHAARERERTWPRLCKVCRREFRLVDHHPKQRRHNSVTCPACRAARRRPRTPKGQAR